MVQLHACQGLAIGITEVRVSVSQQVFIHLQDLVTVVGEVDVHIHCELTRLDDTVRVDRKLPTSVA